MNEIVGTHDVLWLVLDTLRYDVAAAEFRAGRTPNFARLLRNGWEERHTPGSFTYAALHAFFAGFLPTPVNGARQRAERLFAARFGGSETVGPGTKVFDAETIVEGLGKAGYQTICIGGVGFFNQQTPLSCVFPRLFHESHWQPAFGVTDRGSTQHQFEFAAVRIGAVPSEQPAFVFINVSAVHQPNYFYLREHGPDDLDTHAAALRYVDGQLPALLRAFSLRGRPLFFVVCSDHGTAYGEDGFHGHRLAHGVVWTVPYADGVVDMQQL